ncbi:MAG: hypothetical protein U9N84_07045 [Actinomycetota bacterium]|nr:hypothetical protein [Actinomycetota bacterium]
MAADLVSVAELKARFDQAPRSAGIAIDLLWPKDVAIAGSLQSVIDETPGARFDLLQTLRMIAMSTETDPGLVSHLVETATPTPSGDAGALHAAATLALARPATMRWVSRNAVHTASSENWKTALPGLGGAIVSVPLAEEALSNLIAVGAELPAELLKYVQLNPWFSRRFVHRCVRRRERKRLRIHDRAATARAWSHARALLGSQLPAQWRSLHGRGAGRPLDNWSRSLLTDYANLIATAYRSEGIPPAMAALFTVAAAADEMHTPAKETLRECSRSPLTSNRRRSA